MKTNTNEIWDGVTQSENESGVYTGILSTGSSESPEIYHGLDSGLTVLDAKVVSNSRSSKGDELTPTPPKQNTEEIGHWSEPVTEFHNRVSDVLLDVNFLTSNYSRAMMVMDLSLEFQPGEGGIFLAAMPDGFMKIKPQLPPSEYRKLLGEKFWSTIESKYEDEKFLVYDDQQDKDPITQLYPEFDLMFRKSPYVKITWKKWEDDGRPEMSIEFKSDKEYTSSKS